MPVRYSTWSDGSVAPAAMASTVTAANITGKRSFFSNRPWRAAWWLRCSAMPTPCITNRWAR